MELLLALDENMEQNTTEGRALTMCLVAQPYLMGPAKVIQSAKLLHRNLEKLSRVMQSLRRGLPFCYDLHVLYAWGSLLIFVQLGILD